MTAAARAEPPGDEAIRDAEAETDEPSGRFELGLGWNPDENLVLMAGVGNDDLFGTGHGLELTSRVSSLGHRFALVYDAPDLLGSGLDLRTEAFASRRERPGFLRDGVGGQVTASRQLSPTTRAYLGYRIEHVGVELEPVRGVAALTDGTGGQDDLLRGGLVSALRAGIVRSTLTSPYGHGVRAELFVETADPRLGSDMDYRRVGATARHRHDLGGGFTFGLSTRANAVWSGDGRGVPLAERLHWDGHADVRGYGLGSTGPTVFLDGGPRALGGNLEAGGRAELEVPLYRAGGLYASVFYDAGMLANLDAAFAERGAWFQHSAGVGLIWRSPIGPLRLDVAFPLGGDREPQFLFGLGTAW